MPTWGSREPYAAPTAGMTLPRDFSSPGGCDGGMASVILSAAPAAMRPIRSRAYILTPPVEQRRRQPTRRPGAAAHANPCPSTSPSRWTKTILNTIEPLNGTATTTPPKAHGGCPSYRASSAGSGPICRDRTASPRQRWRRSRKPGGHRRLGHPRPHPPADLPGSRPRTAQMTTSVPPPRRDLHRTGRGSGAQNSACHGTPTCTCPSRVRMPCPGCRPGRCTGCCRTRHCRTTVSRSGMHAAGRRVSGCSVSCSLVATASIHLRGRILPIHRLA